MAQDLKIISQEAFKMQLFKLSNKQLVGLLKDVYDLKTEYGHIMNNDEMLDIERKETKINFELMQRKYLTKQDYSEYFAWLKKINKRRNAW